MNRLIVVTGRSGYGKTEYCLNQIADQLESEPQGSPLLFLVPEQASFQMEKELASRLQSQGFVRSQIFGFRRFSHRVLQEIGGSWLPPLSDSGRNLILGKILRQRQDQLLSFGKAAGRPQFAETLSQLIEEFRTHRITPEHLQETAEQITQISLKNKLTDLSLLYNDFMIFLEDHYRDGNDALDRTVEGISDSEWLKDAQVWIDGFDRFTPQEWEIILALAKKVQSVTLTLCVDQPEEALQRTSVFYRPAQTLLKLRALCRNHQLSLEEISLSTFWRSARRDLMYLENSLFDTPSEVTPEPENILLSQFSTPHQEIRQIAHHMMNQVRLHGYRWRDLALLLRQEAPYRELAESIFTEYNMPFYRDQSISPLHHPLVELLCSSFDIFFSHWSPEPIFRVAKTGMLQIDDESLYPLENYVLEFGIKGAKRWSHSEPWRYLHHFSFEEGETDTTEENEIYLEKINQGRYALSSSLLPLEKALTQAINVKEQATALYHFWEALNIDQQLEEMALEAEEKADPETARLHRQIGSEVKLILDELVLLLGEEHLPISEFAKLFKDALEGLTIRLIPPGLDHIMIHSLESVIPPDIHIAYLPGANDGLFPARCQSEGLLSESDRLLLLESGLELSPSNLSNAYNERLLAYRGLVAPCDFLWLSYPLASQDGSTLAPSLLVQRLQELFPTLQKNELQGDDEWTKQPPSQTLFRPLTAVISLATALRRLRDQEKVCDYWRELYNYFLQTPYRDQVKMIISSLLGINQTTALPKLLAHSLYAPTGKLRGSVTRLESFQACPFRHFSQYGLKLKERKEFQLTPPQVGIFLHGALKKYGQELLDQKKKWYEISLEEQDELIGQIITDLSPKLQNEILYSSSQYQYFLARLTETIKESVRHLSAFSEVTAFETFALEKNFGGKETSWPPLRFAIDSDLSLEVSGQIDRIDQLQGEGATFALIIDYKSGSKKLILNEVFHGLSLQLLTYLLVTLKNMESYSGDSKPYAAGVLYYFLKSTILQEESPLSLDEAFKKHNEVLRMPGWLLENKDLIGFIETEFQEIKQTLFVPNIRLTTKGEFHKASQNSLKTQENFDDILQHLEQVLVNSAQEILEGNITISPYQLQKNTPCTFCKYRSFCGFDRFQGNDYRNLPTYSDQEVLKLLTKERSSQKDD